MLIIYTLLDLALAGSCYPSESVRRYGESMIPLFDSNGCLPVGIYWTTWEKFKIRFGVTAHRRRLLDGLEQGLKSLKVAGCSTVYIDGSFVTDKEIPGDFDACWDDSGVDLALLDPVLLNFDNQRAAQKAKYHGEFFPAHLEAETTPPYRIFLDFFQTDKATGDPKGIIAIDLSGW